MFETLYVLKNRNRYEKEEKERRKIELEELRQDGIFRVALSKDVKLLDTILSDTGVKHVDVNIDEKQLVNFHKAIYYEEMKKFNCIPSPSVPTKFRFKTFDI